MDVIVFFLFFMFLHMCKKKILVNFALIIDELILKKLKIIQAQIGRPR